MYAYSDLAVKSYVFIQLLKYFLQSIQSIFDMLLMQQHVSLMLFVMFSQLLKLNLLHRCEIVSEIYCHSKSKYSLFASHGTVTVLK